MSIDIYIFRHGETEWNRLKRWQGQKNDVPLNDRGREQARSLIPSLKDLRLDRILASDLVRAKETAEIVSREINVELHFHSGLRELFFGEAEGLTADEVVQRFGQRSRDRCRSMLDADLDFRFPGGESKNDMLRRSFAAINSYVKEQPTHKKIGIATHGGVIRVLLQHTGEKLAEPTPVANAALFHLKFSPQSESLVYIKQLL